MQSLSHVLFKMDGLCEGVQLFQSQSDLARAIVALRKGETTATARKSTDQKLSNVRVFLNQVLKRRSVLSKKLRQNIVEAAKQRLPSNVDPTTLDRLDEVLIAFMEESRAVWENSEDERFDPNENILALIKAIVAAPCEEITFEDLFSLARIQKELKQPIDSELVPGLLQHLKPA